MTVVRTRTQVEWDIVCNYYKNIWRTPTDSNHWNNYKVNSCITLKDGLYGNEIYHKESHSFEEWKKLVNYNKINMKEEKGMRELMLDVLNKTYDNTLLRDNTVPLFMSNPGMGKSTIVEEFAKSKGVRMLPTILSTRMPNEVCGGLMHNMANKTWEMFDNEELLSLKDGDIWFIDEVFNGTLKQTLDAVLNLLQGRTLPSGKKLARVMIVAASNPQGLINLTPQIKERFIRYDLKFNPLEYQDYLKDRYGIPRRISTRFCGMIEKEKFESNSWNFITPRSIEKSICQIGFEVESPYQDLLLPFLTMKIKCTRDVKAINSKKGDMIEFLTFFKQMIKYDPKNKK